MHQNFALPPPTQKVLTWQGLMIDGMTREQLVQTINEMGAAMADYFSVQSSFERASARVQQLKNESLSAVIDMPEPTPIPSEDDGFNALYDESLRIMTPALTPIAALEEIAHLGKEPFSSDREWGLAMQKIARDALPGGTNGKAD